MSKRSFKKIYPTLEHAAAAALALGIKTSVEYHARYKEDALLPSTPAWHYPDWSGWPAFFGRPRIAPYGSFKEASMAAIALGIKTMSEYSIRYKEDPRLPSNPHHTYRREWSGYPHFFGFETRSFYKTYAEASHAAKALNIRSYDEYMKRYHGDSLLPSNPQSRYKADWTNWYAFLGLKKKRSYKSYEDAKRVVQRAGASTTADYAKLAQQDERLPSSPKMIYKTDWQGWGSFLAPRKPRFYESYGEAQKAARSIGIVSRADYRLCYHLDSKLPSSPQNVYAEDWSGWRSFLGDEAKKRVKRSGSPILIPSQNSKSRGRRREPAYKSFDKAREAARALGVNQREEYEKSYSNDPKLRINPQTIYKASWRGWRFFLTGEDGRLYPTYEEAKTAVRALNIRTVREYRIRYKEDPRLPANPHKIYSEQWESFPSFTGGHGRPLYPNLEDAAKATRMLGIKSVLEYKRRFREDTRLPHGPAQVYRSEWKSWHAFLGKAEPRFYETYSKAKQAAKRLKIQTPNEYMRRYKEDPLLPSNPAMFFVADWRGWPSFLESGNIKYRGTADNAV